MKTSNNTILITGGSSGIGLALAKTFSGLGNKVIITGRDKTKLENVKKQFPDIDTFAGDLTDKTSIDDLVLLIEQKYHNLNVLINNAGVQYNYDFADAPNLIYRIEYEIATNLTAPLKLTGLLLPTLLRNSESAIVNISSALFIAPKKSAPVYCATKSAIHSFSKSLRYQLEGRGVSVFEIIPPLVETAMTEGRDTSKIRPEQLANEVIQNFQADRFESYIGKAKILKLMNRVSPGLADRIMKNG